MSVKKIKEVGNGFGGNYNEYHASLLSELPDDAPIGSVAYLFTSEGIKLAIKTEGIWSGFDGNKKADTIIPIINAINAVVSFVVAGETVEKVHYGDEAEITVTANTGYVLSSIQVNGEDFESGDTVTVGTILKIDVVTIENADLTRNAANCSVAVTVDGSTVEDGERVLEIGSTATITATADDGYSLTSLKVNGEDFTSGSTLTVSGDVVIEAVAEEAPVPSAE